MPLISEFLFQLVTGLYDNIRMSNLGTLIHAYIRNHSLCSRIVPNIPPLNFNILSTSIHRTQVSPQQNLEIDLFLISREHYCFQEKSRSCNPKNEEEEKKRAVDSWSQIYCHPYVHLIKNCISSALKIK